MTNPCNYCHARRYCRIRCAARKRYEDQRTQSTEVLRMAKCKKCGADIIWLKTPKGKWMCADEGLKPYKETKAGRDLVVTDRGETIRCDLEFTGLPTGMARTPHWATCPDSDSFRKPKTEEES